MSALLVIGTIALLVIVGELLLRLAERRNARALIRARLFEQTSSAGDGAPCPWPLLGPRAEPEVDALRRKALL